MLQKLLHFLRRSSPHRDVWFFFHLPKTGGGTLVHGIRDNTNVTWPIDADYPASLDAYASGSVWLGGHTAFGLHEIYGVSPQYISILREPVERIISEFFYSSSVPSADRSIPEADRVSAFIRHVEKQPHLNYYSYMFSDYCFRKQASIERAARDGTAENARQLIARRHASLAFLTHNVPFAEISATRTYSAAASNIRSMFALVGRYESFPETIRSIERKFGFRIDLGRRLHVTPSKPMISDLPLAVQAMLVKKTEADRAIYDEFAVGLV